MYVCSISWIIILVERHLLSATGNQTCMCWAWLNNPAVIGSNYLIIPTLPTSELPPKKEHTCLTTSHSLGGQVFPTSWNPFVAKRQPTGREDLRYSASKRIHVLTCNVDPCFLGSPMVESDHLTTTTEHGTSWATHSFKNTLYPSNTSKPSNCLPPSWSGM